MADEWQPGPPPIDSRTGMLIAQTADQIKASQVKIGSDADAVKNYLAWGAIALSLVKGYMTIGASNQVQASDIAFGIVGWGVRAICVQRARSEEDQYATLDVWSHQMKIADIAKRRGCGNCMEQTAIALQFLYGDGARLFPIDGMEVDAGDHRFVMLGRKTGDVYDLNTWGPRAVIVDPWGDVCYEAKEIRKRRGSGERWSWFCRKES